MICVECGAEVEELHDGLCRECYVKKYVYAEIEDPLKVEVCGTCGAVKRGDKWLERADLNSIMLERIEDSISLSSAVDRYSFEVDFEEGDPRNIEADISAKLLSGDFIEEEELMTHIVLKKSQCKNCSRREGDYYEAILQVRPSRDEMTDEEKEKIVEKVHDRIAVEQGQERKVFITIEEEIHGGLDFYISDKKVTKNLSHEIAENYGGEVTTSASLAGREDGQNVYRMTYSVRLPPFEKGDFIELEEEIYRVKSTHSGNGGVTLHDIKKNKKIRVDQKEIKDVKILGGMELIRKAVVVSETETEVKVLDPDNYDTKTLLKPEGLSSGKDEVDVLKVENKRILLMPPEED